MAKIHRDDPNSWSRDDDPSSARLRELTATVVHSLRAAGADDLRIRGQVSRAFQRLILDHTAPLNFDHIYHLALANSTWDLADPYVQERVWELIAAALEAALKRPD